MKYGIEAASFYVPSLYLNIKELAENREIDSAKLEKGLGLHKMALPDVHEDTATFAAEALLKLIKDYNIQPKDIAKIYLGTESALDAAKPTATYAVQMVEQVLGERCFGNCDVVDMTFACIGGVDALQTCLDFVKVNPDKKAVVIASDYAKYELKSTGEYTQGAGAVALLVSAEPNLLEIEGKWGVATESVFDFFKPRREIAKSDLNVSKLNFNNVEQMKKYTQSYTGGLADSCWAYAVGTPSEKVKNLMDVTKEAMYKGIEQAVVGNRIGDIGAAIQDYAESRGYGVVRDLVGHGVGPTMHEEPMVPNYGIAGRGLRLREGMVLTIEPMINTGDWEIDTDMKTGWAHKTIDGGLSCQYEHQFVITKDGPVILTSQGEEGTY